MNVIIDKPAVSAWIKFAALYAFTSAALRRATLSKADACPAANARGEWKASLTISTRPRKPMA